MSRQQSQKLAVALITLVAVLVFVPVILILFYVIYKGIGAISWEFLTQPPRNGMKEGGIMPAIVGTLILTIGTVVSLVRDRHRVHIGQPASRQSRLDGVQAVG